LTVRGGQIWPPLAFRDSLQPALDIAPTALAVVPLVAGTLMKRNDLGHGVLGKMKRAAVFLNLIIDRFQAG